MFARLQFLADKHDFMEEIFEIYTRTFITHGWYGNGHKKFNHLPIFLGESGDSHKLPRQEKP